MHHKLLALSTIAFFSSVQQARAQATGFVFGTVKVQDTRTPFQAAGSTLDPNRPATLRAAFAMIVVTPLVTPEELDADGLPVASSLPSYAKTDANGLFAIKWEDPSIDANNFDIQLSIDVVWISPDMPVSTDLGVIDTIVHDPPNPRFAIRTEAMNTTVFAHRRIAGAHPGGPDLPTAITLVDFDIAAGADQINAYLTAQEYYNRVVDGADSGFPSFVLSSRMKFMNVFINSILNISPDRYSAHVTGDRQSADAFTIAHEMSHAATWNALDLPFAPVSRPPIEYCKHGACDWTHDSYENERVAWLEGFADAIAGAWLWNPECDQDTDPSCPDRLIPRGVPSGTFRVRDANDNEVDFTDPVNTVTGTNHAMNLEHEPLCEAVTSFGTEADFRQFERTMCQTAAMWDILDDTPPLFDQDDLGVSSLARVFQVLDFYTDSCEFDLFDPSKQQHCANEGIVFYGPIGPVLLNGDNNFNHHDFEFWFVRPDGTDDVLLDSQRYIDEVYHANRIFEGTP